MRKSKNVRPRLHGLLALAASALLATVASADPPQAPPGKANAAAKADDKGKDAKKDDAKKEVAKKDDAKKDGDLKKDDAKKDGDLKKDDDKGKAGEAERAERRHAEHEAMRAKLAAVLKGPPDEALRQELRHHAERTAKLERIKAVATEAKDKDAADKADKLLAKETSRHDKWMSTHASGAPTPAAAPAATTENGGAK